jgi:hypothetical protein
MSGKSMEQRQVEALEKIAHALQALTAMRVAKAGGKYVPCTPPKG